MAVAEGFETYTEATPNCRYPVDVLKHINVVQHRYV